MQYHSVQLKVSFADSLGEKVYDISRLEKLFQIRYLTRLECENWRVESWIRKKCRVKQSRGKIGQLALWLGKLHAKEIERAEVPDVAIRWIDEKVGYGVFATKPLKKWQFIGEYTGLLRQRDFFFPVINDYCFMYPKEWLAPKTFTIDGERQGNFTRFINHSDFPNCESVSIFYEGMFHIIFRTIKDIEEGAQLSYDYGDIYWRRRKKLKEENPEDLISTEHLKLVKAQDFS